MPSEQQMPRSIWLVQGVAIGVVCWMCVVLVLVCLLGDRWWIGTIALFAPRWLLVLPILLGVLLWPWLTRPIKWAVLISGLAACWGVLGFCVPWGGWFSKPEISYRVLTCNVADWSGGTDRLEQLIVDSGADIVMLQEYSAQASFSVPDSWSSHQDGGLLILSRYPLENISTVRRKLPGRSPRAVGLFAEAVTPERTIQLYTLHLLSPRYGLSGIVDSKTIIAPSRRDLLVEEMSKRESESQRVSQAVVNRSGSFVVGGDFNMPVESYIFRKHWSQFQDAFSVAGFGVGYTCFVEKRGIHFGARIDHLLTRGNWRAHRCWVGPDIGSDHRPLLADIYWAE